MEKRQKIYKMIMLVFLTAFLTFLGTSLYIYNYVLEDGDKKYVLLPGNDNLEIGTELERVKTVIDKYFLGEVNEEELNIAAIKGYVEGLGDEYSEYYTPDELEEFYADALGNYTGIGIYMSIDTDNQIIVISPVKDSPAYKAGILPGDIILKVDGENYNGDSLTEASNKIKGQEGETVQLQIKRNEEILDFSIIRENIKLNHVESKILENNIGYLEISSFDEGCADEFEEKYKELEKQGIDSLIIDLRDNPGGIVSEAIDIAEMLVDKGKTLLITVDKNNNEEITKSKQNKIVNVPIVVLVNANSASASEILSGALKDNNAATIVGTKTYGKGVMQEVLKLSDGSAIKLTTNEFFSPNRTKIHKTGIEPDVIVELPNEKTTILKLEEGEEDTQLNKAIEILK